VIFLGLTLLPRFGKDATLLMCPSASGAKFDRACEWGVPVVDMSWLEMMSRSGSIPAPGDFLVAPLRSGALNSDLKGKGKATAIIDDTSVTNSE
jgi:DNA replication regulator DPB11